MASSKNSCSYDERTLARLERETLQTVIGLVKSGLCKKFRKKEASESQTKKQHETEKQAVESENSKKIVQLSDQGYNLAKLRTLRFIKRKKRIEAFLNQYQSWKFYSSLVHLKMSFLRQKWNYTCHLKERMIIRDHNHLQLIQSLRTKFNIDPIIPPDSIIFDKILRCIREKKKQKKLRKQRMLMIIEKITRETVNGIRLSKRPLDIRMIEKIKEMRFEITDGRRSDYSLEEALKEFDEKSFESQSKNLEETVPPVELVEDQIAKSEEKPGEVEQPIEKTSSKDKKDSDKRIARKKSESTEKIYPEDTCFFATPGTVVFDGFDATRTYSKKVTITNKTPKWAYLRFHKVDTDVWEPVIKVNIIDAAKVKPGLNITVSVKFSPVRNEKVSAKISFLTLNPEDLNTFHEFRVPVRCTPKSPLPSLDPPELREMIFSTYAKRFPSGPIWKYNDSRFKERTLTISNEGEKSFSIILEERDNRQNCFMWFFDQGEIHSAKSSIVSTESMYLLNENSSSENMMEYKSEHKYRKRYQIEVPPKVKCILKITFQPKYVGLHHEVLELLFCHNEWIFDKRMVPIWAEVTGYQIHLDPPCIDLGIVMIDSDVCQQTFNIVNTVRNSVEVVMKTPKRLGSQVIVHPRSTIMQPETNVTVSVGLIPESSIVNLSKRFYDRTSRMVEFPIYVQMLSREAVQPPPLILKVLATLTTHRGLVLEPAYVDLGLVYTHESVYAELTLTNRGLLTQEYVFLNLPPSMEIQPNHGFGAILPGETIHLQLIYSSCLYEIPGNEIGANGFRIEVTTLAELVGKRGKIKQNDSKNLRDTVRSMIARRRDLLPPVSSKLITEKTDYDQDEAYDDFSTEMEDSDTEESKKVMIKKSHGRYKRKKKNMIDVRAYIVDTFCELSEQIIEFPATPCGSFSVASVQLRGCNLASYPNCTCGVVKNQDKVFTARFRFKSSSDEMDVIPQYGTLINNQFVRVNFIFRPRLSGKAHQLKSNIEEEEKKSTKQKSAEISKKKAESKKEKLEEKEEKFDIDKLSNEINPLEMFEPFVSTIFITCVINLEMQDGRDLEELLFAKLICPVTKPDILILKEHEIDFGLTAVGLSSIKILFVKNISNNVKVDVSLLDPFGPFFVPPGKTIETGSILKIPVTYQPTTEQQEEEYFEVSSSKTRTRWRVKVTGCGVVPSYVVKPSFRVARFNVVNDETVELKISIHNTGTCPLTFQLCVIDVLEGVIPPQQEESLEISKTTEKKNKKKADKEGGKKSAKKMELGNDLLPHEEAAIFGGNLKQSADQSRFSFRNFDDNMRLIIRENKKVEFIVRFQSEPEESVSPQKEGAKATSNKDKKTKSLENEKNGELNYCHVAVMKLMLGSLISIQEFVMICWIN